MRHKQRPQDALSVVSYLFLIVGLIAFLGMVFHAATGSFHLSFGILGIAIFWGLRRYSRPWRMCALLVTWYGIVTLSLALFFCLNDQAARATPILFSERFSKVPADWLFLPLLALLLMTLWQYYVLTHPAVRRLFNLQPAALNNTPRPTPVSAEMDEAIVK